ncbi:Gfo/Idh/MocA family oxidoreductase [Streptomyces sp. SID13726]|uniref:Gfo/Idh/MocA family oxidoreductase n=1 Tax=Streptomyces sp. SID13726 TaxID=2706058 RepID=UPI0013BBE5F3|nr:Gfo/Idh/MocA family oxidoreductase [Streptomyces sp. SID13726]NEB03373.1 Gfo/Idh/MocA family oxidoreductase [Streptomyces sp. SID13726]
MTSRASGTHVCVIGYGAAGRLHQRLLGDLGFDVSVVDPAPGDRSSAVPVVEHPEQAARRRPVDIWSVCSPTATHVAAVADVLAVDPAARLLVEKPLCRAREIPELTALLDRHPDARLVVMDQYRHSQAMALLRTLRRELAPRHELRALRVGFGKDRRADIAAGRFVDHDYGVFGYEWLHMLALVRGALPTGTYDRYMGTGPGEYGVRVATDPELTSTAAHEHAVADGVDIELYSTVVGPDPSGQVPVPSWFDLPVAEGESRQRHVEVLAGPVRFALDLDPVTLPRGTRLPRNTHRLAVQGPDLRREWLIHDSPLDNALRWSAAALLGPDVPPGLDLRGVSRIDALARTAHPSVRS